MQALLGLWEVLLNSSRTGESFWGDLRGIFLTLPRSGHYLFRLCSDLFSSSLLGPSAYLNDLLGHTALKVVYGGQALWRSQDWSLREVQVRGAQLLH